MIIPSTRLLVGRATVAASLARTTANASTTIALDVTVARGRLRSTDVEHEHCTALGKATIDEH
eukprot:3108459-Pyramimonas_sp.AAC.1